MNIFCGFSQKVDEALQSKQAQPLIERVDADLNYREIFKQWLPLLQQALKRPPATTAEPPTIGAGI